MQKQLQWKVKGMQRDLSVSAFNSEYAYENKNIRIMPTDESTLFSIINEKGNLEADINGIDSIKGIPIGQCLINDELVLFTTDGEDINKKDSIYKLWFENNVLNGKLLFEGDLGLNSNNPIESISFYENENIRKVYWTDGLNQPRVINIAASEESMKKWNNHSFNFVRNLRLQEEVTIERNIVASGIFSPGIIQYAFTYFDKYGQESNIFYVSPLYYISYNNRGASPEDKVGNSFNITIENIDNNFDYIRIYSIHRTSIDAVPTAKRVVDLAPPERSEYQYDIYSKVGEDDGTVRVSTVSEGKYRYLDSITPSSITTTYRTWNLSYKSYSKIVFSNGDYALIGYGKTMVVTLTKSGQLTLSQEDNSKFNVSLSSKVKVTYTDNGSSGDSIDPTELLYVGGEEAVFGTMAQKDNTLFLGNIKIKRKIIDSTIRNHFNDGQIIFKCNSITGFKKYLTPPQPTGYYPYDNQLKLNSFKIKTFKYLETYRFGVQFQHVTGKWSEPIWINDVRNDQHIQCDYIKGTDIHLPIAEYTLDNQEIINRLYNQGYVRIRPVVVYPSITDRECICQGILCPTVFNVGDRQGNSPFSQSSWFTRANAPYDEYKAFHYTQDNEGNWGADWWNREIGPLSDPSPNSRAGVMGNNRVKVDYNGESFTLEIPNKGAWAEFRHLYPIPSNDKRNAEIQCIYNPPTSTNLSNNFSEEEINDWVSKNIENFYIDQSILTFHSPDIEFNEDIRSIDTSGLQLRIVGMVPLTAFIGDIDIQTSTSPNNYLNTSEIAPGFYKEPVCDENVSRFGWKGLMSGAFWFDEISGYNKDVDNPEKLTTGFVVYPFHRNGSLNNTKWADNGYRSAMLDKKKLSNMRFSYNTYFFDSANVYNFYEEGSTYKTGISGIAVFDSDEVSLVRLPAQKNSGLGDINYYGNVDKVISVSRIGDKKDGYPIIVTGSQSADTNAHTLFSNNYMQIDGKYTGQTTGIDPVRMRYKSTPHAVIALNYSSNNYQCILPTIKDGDSGYGGDTELWNVNKVGPISFVIAHQFWDNNRVCKGIYQDILQVPLAQYNGSYNGYSIEYGWLWLGEIYNPNVVNRFGGRTEEAFENNQWLPCGEPISILDDNNILKSYIKINWIEGDTYYQRYDHLKTYPFSLEEQNAITDIVSFMCETRVNIDGRYDRNRGQTNNFAVTPTNFNLMNDVYSQQNNFFVYRSLNPNKLNLDNFRNSMTWTKTKTAGELVDTWTNITLASTLDFDGDKGDIRAVRRFNNNLITFQDKGISQILYNENMQITTTQGNPIEIANSGKVSGKRYITDKFGCSNKWSICETPNGIYFIDDITKGIFLFNGKLVNLSDKFGFHSWINSRSTGINIWNPKDFNGFVTYYDKVNGDVFFISKDECLAFSEPLGQFTSFYSYENVPYFINIEDKGVAFNTENGGSIYKAWLHNEGDYNMYFNKYNPFYTIVIANQDMPKDKTFNNLDFRADSWNDDTLLNTTFDTLTVWNEYQKGTSSLTNILGKPSSLKKKFRIWRANIPRDDSNKMNRMRNPWLYIKLSMEHENTDKTVLHDMIIHYFE